MEHFFKPNRIYAVVGASSNPAKYGNKVLNWYKTRNLPVIPVNPKPDPILDLKPVKSVADIQLPSGHDIAVSVVTPPEITRQLVEALPASGPVKALWLQPNTHNPEIVRLAQGKVPDVITKCILMNGDKYLNKAPKI